MFEEFVTWDMLQTYATFVMSVFMFVEFTKEMSYVKNIKTKYYSAFIAFLFLIIVNLYTGAFNYWDVFLYMLSAISISLTSNGLADFNKKVLNQKDYKDNK